MLLAARLSWSRWQKWRTTQSGLRLRRSRFPVNCMTSITSANTGAPLITDRFPSDEGSLVRKRGSYGKKENDVRPDCRQPRVLSGSPGEVGAGRNDAGAGAGGDGVRHA